jgi:hypothetical protein
VLEQQSDGGEPGQGVAAEGGVFLYQSASILVPARQ